MYWKLRISLSTLFISPLALHQERLIATQAAMCSSERRRSLHKPHAFVRLPALTIMPWPKEAVMRVQGGVTRSRRRMLQLLVIVMAECSGRCWPNSKLSWLFVRALFGKVLCCSQAIVFQPYADLPQSCSPHLTGEDFASCSQF
jgi:hypothetical protein